MNIKYRCPPSNPTNLDILDISLIKGKQTMGTSKELYKQEEMRAKKYFMDKGVGIILENKDILPFLGDHLPYDD